MNRARRLAVLALTSLAMTAPAALAQRGPYIGFVYPAGGQQGTTFSVKLGGQGLDGVDEAIVSGNGVSARVVEYHRKIGPQEIQLLREQLRNLKRGSRGAAARDKTAQNLIAKIEKRISEYVQRPAVASISSLVYVEVTMAPDAEPGQRELRLVTPRGVSNPLVFYVGQLPEVSRKPMTTSHFQVLGKEYLAQRKRPDDEVEVRITLPCTMNGQIASGEVNRYRFEARKGQRLVISTLARQLIPYIADAVPGWFQPVLRLCDHQGKEVAFNDDYRFKPDPVILFEVPKDGEYVLSVTDAIYRGREDFVYRIAIGELPFVTSIFPLGTRAGEPAKIELDGWNLQNTQPTLPHRNAKPGVYSIAARRRGFLSNGVPFALGTLPECFDRESNDSQAAAQKVELPIVINGRMDRRDDWDVFRITGTAGATVVAEVQARRLDSPMDSLLKVTDASGKVLAFNDDHEDAESGLNTHHADSYVMFKLPADGDYFVYLGDTARNGGREYGYRLRLSAPRPDFALRVVPSNISLRSRSNTAFSVYAFRKDGFDGPIKLFLPDSQEGFVARPVTLQANKTTIRLPIKTYLRETREPVSLAVQGMARAGDRKITHEAVAAEDRMQAFLWRHLVPAEELKVLVYNPANQPPPKRVRPKPDPSLIKAKAEEAKNSGTQRKFTKRQVAGRLRQIDFLYQEGLLTDDFTNEKVAECEAAL